MLYHILYWMMLIGFLGVSMQSVSPKIIVIGVLLTMVNAILFWR
jgi:hypothetical protein